MGKPNKRMFSIGENAVVEYNDINITFKGLVEGVRGTDVYVHLSASAPTSVIVVSTTTASVRTAVC